MQVQSCPLLHVQVLYTLRRWTTPLPYPLQYITVWYLDMSLTLLSIIHPALLFYEHLWRLGIPMYNGTLFSLFVMSNVYIIHDTFSNLRVVIAYSLCYMSFFSLFLFLKRFFFSYVPQSKQCRIVLWFPTSLGHLLVCGTHPWHPSDRFSVHVAVKPYLTSYGSFWPDSS